jgi:hypothetical protein
MSRQRKMSRMLYVSSKLTLAFRSGRRVQITMTSQDRQQVLDQIYGKEASMIMRIRLRASRGQEMKAVGKAPRNLDIASV